MYKMPEVLHNPDTTENKKKWEWYSINQFKVEEGTWSWKDINVVEGRWI